MKKEKKGKRKISYFEAHNKAVRAYQKSSIFLLWAGIINLFSLIIGLIQIAASKTLSGLTYAWPESGFSMNFSLQQLFNRLLIENIASSVLAYVLLILIALFLSASFAFLGFFASRGKKWILLSGFSLYCIDFILLFIFVHFSLIPFVWTNYAFSLATHVVILIACIIAIIEYYNVIHIEKVFKGEDALKLNEEVESEVIANGD